MLRGYTHPTATVPSVDTLVLTFDAPGVPLSINKANSLHWAARRRHLLPWRIAVAEAYRSAGSPEMPRSSVHVAFPFPQKARRDPHNYVAPMVKALIDELVAEGCWPDDTPQYVSVIEPTLVAPATECVITITPL